MAKRDMMEAKDMLLKFLKPGDKVYTIIRHVSSSGMMRAIDLYQFRCIDGVVEKIYLSGYVARFMGYTLHKEGGIKVSGCGMDMGFHLVSTLSRALFPDAMRPDYALNQEWI